MIKTKSARKCPSPDDGLRVLILGFEGVLGVEVFSNLILPELMFDEDPVPLRPSFRRLDLFSRGKLGWESFEELYRSEICHSDSAYREIERYATLSRKQNVTFIDMCDESDRSLRKTIAEMCGCVISTLDLRIE